MDLTLVAVADLFLLVATAVFGLLSLSKWLQYRKAGFPVARITMHITLQMIAISLWIGFVLTGAVFVAWSSFIVLTAGQVFGDLLMFASYRARHRGEERASYLKVGGDVLSFRRPVAGFHALLGAVAWFGMLAICVVATVAG